MIQFNLLPDVKIEYVKAQQTKRLVLGIAMVATASSFAVFLLLFLTVHGVQRKSMNDVSKDVAKYTAQLQGTKDLNKILTIQNQLSALNGLHNQKVVASREFGFIQQVTPADVSISRLATDFTANTLTIVGAAPSLDRVNTFADTLKFATFSDGTNSASKAFSDVVLSQFGRDNTSTTFTVTLNFAPALFTNDSPKTLTVPKTVTTRSITEQPSAIFQKITTSSSTGTNP